MKIAYLVPYIIQCGPVNVVYYLCNELNKEHEIDVYYFKDINKLEFPVPTHKISFFEKIDFDNYDVIHSHGVMPDAYVWWHKHSIVKAKTVTTLHNYVKEDFKYAYNPLKAFLLAKAWNIITTKHDQIVTLSKDAVQYYRKFWKNKNITYVYNGIPENINSNNTNQTFDQDHNIKIGAIGSGDITRRKGFDQIIYALKKLPNHSFYIAGTGQQIENLNLLASECNVRNRIHFVGFQKDITSFINTMDIMTVPSRSEGFSLALQEVARQKKPAVCSDIPIFRELFSTEEIVFFKLESTNDLIKAIKIASSPKENFAENIHKKFLSSFTSSKMAENYLNLYKTL